MNDKLMQHLSGFEKTYPHKLESHYPQIVEKIVQLWGKPELSGYFHSLLIDLRGSWQALPDDIAREILLLNSTYDKIRASEGEVTVAYVDEAPAAKPEPKPEPPKFVPTAEEKETAKQEIKLLNLDFTPGTMLKLAESDDPAPIELFIKAGMPVDAADEKGWTSLMVASFKGSDKVADVLIQYGANPAVRDRNGYTPLHWASLNGYREIVGHILIRGNDRNIQSNHGLTSLLQAAAMGHAAIVGDLLKAGADPNLASHDGWTPLHKAVANGHKEVVIELLKYGAVIDAQHEDGTTPLSLAQKRKDKNPEILDLLLARMK
jgi:hypothetical protein